MNRLQRMEVMIRVVRQLLGCIALVVCTTVIGWGGWGGWAGAAVLSLDPDFGQQTLNSTLATPATPWNLYSGGSFHTATFSAQSPFTSVFANNHIGVTTPAAAGNPYFVGGFTPEVPNTATGFLYLNVDFRNHDESADAYTLTVSKNAGVQNTVMLAVGGGSLLARSSAGWGSSIVDPVAGVWYNVQLTLDMNTDTYSGTVTPYGGTSVPISSRPFISDAGINNLFSDGGSDFSGGVAPGHDIDNFALLSTAPAPSPIRSIVNIDFDGFRTDDVQGPTYVGEGAARGGTVFNSLPANSMGNTNIPGDPADNLTVGASDLLDSYGTQTTLDFTVSPVGGDVAGAGTPTTDPFSSAALHGDYIFDHSAGNDSDSPFTISGFDPVVSSADIYFYHGGGTILIPGETPDPFTPSGIFNSGNTVCFLDVPVVGGQISGQFGPGTTVIKGITIVSKVPEPGTMTLALSGLAVVGALLIRRRRECKRVRASKRTDNFMSDLSGPTMSIKVGNPLACWVLFDRLMSDHFSSREKIMLRKNQSVSVAWVLGIVLFAVALGTVGQSAGAVLTPDPDFGLQTPGITIRNPWYPPSGTGGNAATDEAQSPFTNVFADNDIGANTPATAGTPYFVGFFSDAATPAPTISKDATGLLYFNADFRNKSTEGGDYDFVVTSGASGAKSTAAVYVAGGAIYAERAYVGGVHDFGPPILNVRPNVWYNVQLTLDLSSDTYSGTVTQYGGATTSITSRPFVHNEDINCIYTDSGINLVPGAAPDHDIDNFVLSDAPLPRRAKLDAAICPIGSGAEPDRLLAIRGRQQHQRFNPSEFLRDGSGPRRDLRQRRDAGARFVDHRSAGHRRQLRRLGERGHGAQHRLSHGQQPAHGHRLAANRPDFGRRRVRRGAGIRNPRHCKRGLAHRHAAQRTLWRLERLRRDRRRTMGRLRDEHHTHQRRPMAFRGGDPGTRHGPQCRLGRLRGRSAGE